MKKFNNWLNVRINEAEEPSYIPMLQQKIEKMRALLTDLDNGGKYNMVRYELGEEVIKTLEKKLNRYVDMVSNMMQNVHGAS